MFSFLEFNIAPVIWWKEFVTMPQHQELRTLALKLLSVPATSASSERNWSALCFLCTVDLGTS